jgi:hypothetical protein
MGPAVAAAAPSDESLSLSGGADTPPERDTPAAEAPAAEESAENPATYEFAFVSVGAAKAWAIAGNTLFFGAGGTLGPPLYRYSKLGDNQAGWDPGIDILSGVLFVRVSPSPYLDIDVGPKLAIGSALYNVTDAPQSAFSVAGYADLRVGSRTVKVGPRFEVDRIAYSNYYESGWRLTPLMLRVVH